MIFPASFGLLVVSLITCIFIPLSVHAEELSAKAAHFERMIRERHVKDGFIRELSLNIPGDPSKGGMLHHSDNDGLWTSLYVAAMSFKYSVLKDSETRNWAQESLNALLRLEQITGISGFPARSIVPAGDPKKYIYDGEWHLDASGQWEWKGNTSADEIVGHFFAYSLYYDLVADEAEKQKIRATVGRIMDHIIQNDWYLVDLDGQPTRWGVWNPKQLNQNVRLPGGEDIDWSQERALNSLEILSHLKTAYHVTEDNRYQKQYLMLIRDHGYAKNILGNVIDRQDINHSDVELAFSAYYPLLLYEKDPKLLQIYKKSLRQTWELVRLERNPWWNFTHCAFIKEGCALDDARRTLQEIPHNQLNWKKSNSGRKDIKIDSRFIEPGKLQSVSVLPYDQVVIQRWNGNPYLLDTGNEGEIEGDGVLFMLPYWMGRHHKYVQ